MLSYFYSCCKQRGETQIVRYRHVINCIFSNTEALTNAVDISCLCLRRVKASIQPRFDSQRHRSWRDLKALCLCDVKT